MSSQYHFFFSGSEESDDDETEKELYVFKKVSDHNLYLDNEFNLDPDLNFLTDEEDYEGDDEDYEGEEDEDYEGEEDAGNLFFLNLLNTLLENELFLDFYTLSSSFPTKVCQEKRKQLC